MGREEKIQQRIEELRTNYESNRKTLTFKLFLDDESKPYTRERHTRFGGKNGKGHFYNARSGYMGELNKIFSKQLSKEQKELINTIITNKEKNPYYVEIKAKFFLKIPKSDSIEITAMKEAQLLKPTNRRGDVDNYIKLILDTLHGVVYDDDAHVTKILSEKFYSLHPRVELEITIEYEV